MNSTELPNTPDKGQAPTVPSIHIRFISICMAVRHLLHPPHHEEGLHQQCCILQILLPFIVNYGFLAQLLGMLLRSIIYDPTSLFLRRSFPFCRYLWWNCCHTRLPVKLKLGTRVIIFRSYFCSAGGILQAAKTQNLEWRRYGDLVCCDTAALLSSCFDGCSLRA